MFKILSDLCSSQKMVSIYTSFQDTSKFHFGTVLAVNNNEVAICMVSQDGDDDGIIAMNSENVFRIELDGQYANKMKKLCSGKDLFLEKILVNEKEIFLSLLTHLIEKKEIVSIELNDSGYSDVIGFVEMIKQGECVIKQVDEYGVEDGFSYILIKDITKINFGSQEEKRIMRLWQLNNKCE